MLAVIYLALTSLAGCAVMVSVLPAVELSAAICGGVLAGFIGSIWLTYVLAATLNTHLSGSLTFATWVTILVCLVILAFTGRSLLRRISEAILSVPDLVVVALSAFFSYWLISQRMGYDQQHTLVVSANTWGDTALHMANARSFSVGANYPTQYPFFAGPSIRYHFGYDFMMGVLQKGGLNLLDSFRVPAALFFTVLLVLGFRLARLLFGVRGRAYGATAAQAPLWWRDIGFWSGVVTVVLLVTNQSLEWLRYVTNEAHGSYWRALTPSLWWDHSKYLSIGPYTNDRIAIYDTLNEYLTESHEIPAVAIGFFVFYVVLTQLIQAPRLRWRPCLAVGILLGLSLWINAMVWSAEVVLLVAVVGIFAGPDIYVRRHELGRAAVVALRDAWGVPAAALLGVALVIGLPQLKWLSQGDTDVTSAKLQIGYLVCSSTAAPCHSSGHMDVFSVVDWWSFLGYWWLNRGLVIPLLVLAYIIGSRFERKLLIAVTVVLGYASVIQIGSDLGATGHKLVNLWANLTDLFAAYALVRIVALGIELIRGQDRLGWFAWSAPATSAQRSGSKQRSGKKNKKKPEASRSILGVAGAVVLAGSAVGALVLTASGVLDLSTIRNDYKVSVFGDAPEPQVIQKIVDDTDKKGVFLTNYDDLYTAPTMAGRRIFLGYTPWTSAAGYDVAAREPIVRSIYQAGTVSQACGLLTSNHINYVMVGPSERTTKNFTLNASLFASMTALIAVTDPQNSANNFTVYAVAKNCS